MSDLSSTSKNLALSLLHRCNSFVPHLLQLLHHLPHIQVIVLIYRWNTTKVESMKLKLHASMASIPHTVFTHFSSFIPFYTYAVPNASRHRNDNTNNCSTHKIPLLPKEKHPNEQKLKLDHQNQNLLNVDFAALCEEGNLDQVLELKGQGVVADYRVYLTLLNL